MYFSYDDVFSFLTFFFFFNFFNCVLRGPNGAMDDGWRVAFYTNI